MFPLAEELRRHLTIITPEDSPQTALRQHGSIFTLRSEDTDIPCACFIVRRHQQSALLFSLLSPQSHSDRDRQLSLPDLLQKCLSLSLHRFYVVTTWSLSFKYFPYFPSHRPSLLILVRCTTIFAIPGSVIDRPFRRRRVRLTPVVSLHGSRRQQ